MALDIRPAENGVVFTVKVTPNAGKNALAGEHNGMMKVKIAAQPEKGKANGELIDYLSGLLGIRKAQVEIIKGETSRQKTVKITGITMRDIKKLEA